jgi:hypothetical protein
MEDAVMRSQNLPGNQVKIGWQRTLHEASLGRRKQLQGVLNLAARIIQMVWTVGEEAGGCHIPKASCKRNLLFVVESAKLSATKRIQKVPEDWRRLLERRKRRRERRRKRKK